MVVQLEIMEVIMVMMMVMTMINTRIAEKLENALSQTRIRRKGTFWKWLER